MGGLSGADVDDYILNKTLMTSLQSLHSHNVAVFLVISYEQPETLVDYGEEIKAVTVIH